MRRHQASALYPGCQASCPPVRLRFQRLKLQYDEPLSDFVCNFSLRRYSVALRSDSVSSVVGGCILTLCSAR